MNHIRLQQIYEKASAERAGKGTFMNDMPGVIPYPHEKHRMQDAKTYNDFALYIQCFRPKGLMPLAKRFNVSGKSIL